MAKDKMYIKSMKLWIESMKLGVDGRRKELSDNKALTKSLKTQNTIVRKLIKFDELRIVDAEETLKTYLDSNE